MKNIILKRIVALFCDIGGAYLLMLAYLCLFKPVFNLSTMEFFMLCIILYFVVCHMILKSSLFQYLLHLKPVGKPWIYLTFKLSILAVIPLAASQFSIVLRKYLWHRLYKYNYPFETFLNSEIGLNNSHLLIILTVYILFGTVEVLFLIFNKKSICEIVGKTNIIESKYSINPWLYGSMVGLIIVLMMIKPVKMISLRCKYQYNAYYVTPSFPPIPLTERIKYTKFFKANKQSPKEYLYKLFEKYDIVCIDERYHPEYTQWELFSDIICDEEFAEKIGVLCTEIGSQDQQKDIDEFMKKKFKADSLMEMEAAAIIRCNDAYWPVWPLRNIFDFTIKLHNYNIRHDSSQKIRWYFCHRDQIWNTVKNLEELYQYQLYPDSTMGGKIIEIHNKQLQDSNSSKKLLFIANYTHCCRNIYHNQKTALDYVEKAFPGKVGVIYIPSAHYASGREFFIPVEMGLWDEAAKHVGYPFAISIKENFIGEKIYDGEQNIEKTNKLKWKNLFDGILFINHPANQYWNQSGFPYMFKGYRKEYIRRCELKGEKEIGIQDLKYWDKNSCLEDNQHPLLLKKYNIIHDSFHYFILCLILLTLLYNKKHIFCK